MFVLCYLGCSLCYRIAPGVLNDRDMAGSWKYVKRGGMVFPRPAADWLGVLSSQIECYIWNWRLHHLKAWSMANLIETAKNQSSRGQVEIAAGAIGTGWEISLAFAFIYTTWLFSFFICSLNSIARS